MWNPSHHTDDENLRWALLRAVEWKEWPLFISQPVVPVLLYRYPWWSVVGILVVVTFAWRLTVAPRFTPWTAIDNATYFVLLRFVMSPLMAYLIWRNGYPWVAALALFWPWAGNAIVCWLLTIPEAVLIRSGSAQAGQIGVIQRRLMSRFGYTRLDAEVATD
jgi:hypothetical protein